MGRPDKLTPEAHAAIVKALAIGCTRKDAALSAGVSVITFLNWLDRGRQARNGKFFEFLKEVERSEAEARMKYTATIAKAAADGDWRAAEAFLRMRDPENWGGKQIGDKDRPVRQIIEIVYQTDAAGVAPGAVDDQEDGEAV